MKLKLQSLQMLRGIAALLVVIYHLSATTFTYFNHKFLNLTWSWVGVDVFFVLSGFLITYIHFDDIISKGSTSKYLKKRFMRIFPVYWVILTSTVCIYIFLMNGATGHSNQMLRLENSSTWVYLLGNYALFPIPNYVIGVAWSLAYEILFYLLFAFCILFGLRFTKSVVPLLVISILMVSFSGIRFFSFPLTFISNPIILEFFMGCLIGYLFKYKSNLLKRKHFAITLVLLTVCCFVNYGIYNSPFNRDLFSLILIGLVSSFLILGAAVLDKSGLYIVPRPFVILGDASYAIYLTHPILLSMMCRMSDKVLSGLHLKINLSLLFTIILIITLLAGTIFHFTIEKPLLKLLNKKHSPKAYYPQVKV
ncbi:MAG TPA: acyltransferase [Pedobacter sp.]|uniref:acyltransferase family protein n=1 Tax=Pedobacter sp. TaxID=1411316 RepID=UPI002BC60AB6|nr:acyltransferase [Pedobacter sp.]HMI01431.1 acyltransferase [Pedobacter sp.]